MAVTIGFLVAVTSNVSLAFQQTYDFEAYQTGLCFIAAVIGSLLGIYCGGSLSESVADFLTKRNGGVREPEMRLPTIVISCITTPLALILYGVGIEHKLHWICPTFGLGLCKFAVLISNLHSNVASSKLLYCASHEHFTCVHYRLVQTYCWRGQSGFYGVQM
jgi:hypothetical protein